MDLRSVAAIAALITSACGGSPSGPSPVPSPTPAPAPTARDGWSESAVAAEFSPAAPAIGSAITVRAPGFLLRETTFTGEPLYLWPQDEEYVRALVYNEFVPARRLSRWAGTFDVEPIEGEPTSVLGDAVAELRRVTGLDIGIRAGGQVRVVVDPTDPALEGGVALARITFSGNVVTGARIVLGDARLKPNTLLHEFGHVLGLGHSTDTGDVMATIGRTHERRFSEREAVALKLMYRWRRAGNFAPDRDPGPGVTAARVSVVVVEE